MKQGILTLAILAGIAGSSFSATIVVPVGSTVIGSWSFDSSTTTGTGASISEGVADIGSQTSGSAATGLHLSASTVYSLPSGNGSAKSLSSNNWAVGDYYQFVVSATGFSNINVTFGQAGSSTGPKDFKLSYSTDGTTFSDFSSPYVVPLSSFSVSSFQSSAIFAFDLSAITALNNASSITFRLVDNSTTSIGNGTVATTGTDRVDDFTVSSGPVTLTSSVPEPSTFITVLGGVGMLMGFRRLRGANAHARRNNRFAPRYDGLRQ